MDTVRQIRTGNEEYIKNRLEDDIMNAQISLKEFADPFTDKPVK